MRTILHILTRPEEPLAEEIIARQQVLPGTTVEIVRLNSGAPDYDSVVEKIFAADSIEVW